MNKKENLSKDWVDKMLANMQSLMLSADYLSDTALSMTNEQRAAILNIATCLKNMASILSDKVRDDIESLEKEKLALKN